MEWWLSINFTPVFSDILFNITNFVILGLVISEWQTNTDIFLVVIFKRIFPFDWQPVILTQVLKCWITLGTIFIFSTFNRLNTTTHLARVNVSNVAGLSCLTPIPYIQCSLWIFLLWTEFRFQPRKVRSVLWYLPANEIISRFCNLHFN